MEHRSHTPTNQTPPPQQQQHYFANGFPFQSLSPADLNNWQQTTVYLPPSIDVDQSLADGFSSLSISQNNHTDLPTFLPQTFNDDYGGVSAPIGGEGFINPYCSESTFDESWRVLNDVGNHQRVYSDVGHDNPLPVDPHHQNSPVYWCNREFLPGTRTSSFDSRFDWDESSYLLATERLYAAQNLNSYHNLTSSIPSPAILDESLLYNHNFHHTNNRNHGRSMPNILRNHPFLSSLPLKNLRGMIYFLAKDQNGCRILQTKFENPTKEEIEFVFSEVIGSFSDLMTDQFGNYLIQKLIAVCNADQKGIILRELTRRPFDIILVSMNPYGTRAIQKLLEKLEDPNLIMIVTRALHLGAAKLAIDPNGHHVIQLCLARFDSSFNQLILEDIVDNCFSVATDRSGCCVLQTCLDRASGKVRSRLIYEIMMNAIQIAEDRFGNYVIQHVVSMKNPEITKMIVRQLRGHFASLSRNKYASNLVERFLLEAGSDICEKIVLELVITPNPLSLLLDPYGNFVIQSALKASKGMANKCLEKLIARNVSSMQNNIFGKKVLVTFDKRKIAHM